MSARIGFIRLIVADMATVAAAGAFAYGHDRLSLAFVILALLQLTLARPSTSPSSEAA